MRRIPGVNAVVVFLLAPAAAGADTWSRSFTTGARPEIAVHTEDGHVTVVRGPDRRVSFTVTTTGWRIPDDVRVDVVRSDPSGVSLRVREPNVRFDFGSKRHTVEVQVVVPSELDLQVTTGDGRVVLPALRGAIDVRTGDGDVTAEGLQGDLRFESGDGRLRARDLRGRLVARSGDGRVQVHGRFEQLDLGTGDGPVSVDVLPGSRPAGPWSIVTGDGPIVLRVPDDLAVDLDLRTGDGHIDLDLPVTVQGRVSRQSMRAPLNGGGPTLRIRTGDGPITVGPLESEG